MALLVARLQASELFSVAVPDVLARHVSLRYCSSTKSEKGQVCSKFHNLYSWRIYTALFTSGSHYRICLSSQGRY